MDSRHRTASLEPAPAPQRGGERAARVIVALAVCVLLGLAVWPILREHGAGRPDGPTWEQLAPPEIVPMRTWRWIVLSGVATSAHVRLAPAPGDELHVEALPPWSLQQPVPGYPAEAIVIAVVGNHDGMAVERRAAAVAAVLMGRIPTLSIARTGVDRHGGPRGVDQQRLRFMVREQLGR
ncbi:MAG: hypothetical protein J0M02_17185 [Planctomycetes bacterium]|nr:hypothetical protein [Planctomycetota bacterium]